MEPVIFVMDFLALRCEINFPRQKTAAATFQRPCGAAQPLSSPRVHQRRPPLANTRTYTYQSHTPNSEGADQFPGLSPRQRALTPAPEPNWGLSHSAHTPLNAAHRLALRLLTSHSHRRSVALSEEPLGLSFSTEREQQRLTPTPPSKPGTAPAFGGPPKPQPASGRRKRLAKHF